MTQTEKVSLILQRLSHEIDAALEHAAGEKIAFVLLLSTDMNAQYVSNAKREDGLKLIESLYSRWKVGKADIPAHYNPDLKMPPN